MVSADIAEMSKVERSYYDLAACAGLHSALVTPLVSNDKIIGTLMLRSRAVAAYAQRDVDLIERIGTQIAGALVNSQLWE